ncbi:MAG: carboxypeptidase regulatory-like domain-containing protein [Verrucomicrobia bacterium]|nr:carboxypeptidase regulatory-like domain-containing protein [Verrucomicrobiota bacterium]
MRLSKGTRHLWAAAPLAVALLLSHSQGFVSNRNETGQSRRWKLSSEKVINGPDAAQPLATPIPYHIATSAFSPTNTAAEINAVRASFDQWQSIPGTSLRFSGVELAQKNPDANPNDGTNLVFWATESAFVNGGRDNILGTLSLAFPRVDSNNTLLECDIVLNGVQFNWFTDFGLTNSPDQFVESSILHEIGHFIGLDHSPAGGATLFARGTTGIGTQAGLSTDEIAAARWLYPISSPKPAGGTIQGRIRAKGIAVHGAVISAENAFGNLISATVSQPNGDYELPQLPTGPYTIRATPLDPPSGNSLDRLLSGIEISKDFVGANTFFAATHAVLNGEPSRTNHIDFDVANRTSTLRITRIQPPSEVGNAFVAINAPAVVEPGASNVSIGVYSPVPLSEFASFSITGDGVSLVSFRSISDVFPGSIPSLNLVTALMAVSSDAAPGLRSFVLQDGAETTFANGFLEIAPAQVDFNFDGMEDSFQRMHFPLFTGSDANPESDPDADGMRNREEHAAGTDPTNQNSLIRIDRVALTKTGTVVTWQSVPGKAYQLLVRSQFGTERWQPVGLPVIAIRNMAESTDSAESGAFRFYRIQLVP